MICRGSADCLPRRAVHGHAFAFISARTLAAATGRNEPTSSGVPFMSRRMPAVSRVALCGAFSFFSKVHAAQRCTVHGYHRFRHEVVLNPSSIGCLKMDEQNMCRYFAPSGYRSVTGTLELTLFISVPPFHSVVIACVSIVWGHKDVRSFRCILCSGQFCNQH